jgi:hypothetical protein
VAILASNLRVMSAIVPIGCMSVGGRNSSRFLQWHRADVAALFAALGAAQALFHRLERGVPPAQMGQKIGVSLSLVRTLGTFQIQKVLPEFIGKPTDIEIAPHARYCI